MIHTEHLTLRRYRNSDLPDLYAYLSDPEVVKFEPYRPMTEAEAAAALAVRMADEAYIAVELREEHRLIGNLYWAKREGGSRELGFVFHRDYWGKGYAKEACAALLRQSAIGHIPRVEARCDVKNEASWHLLEALGFTREKLLPHDTYFWTDEAGQPIWKDTYVYALTN